MGENIRLCKPEIPVALNALELTSMIALAFKAKMLRSAVNDPAKMQRAPKGSWARKRMQRRVLGSASRDSMWWQRQEGFLSL